MTALIWWLACLSQVLSALSELPQPVNLTLNSDHFIHILTWESGPGTPKGVYYQVTVHTEMGSSWVPVVGCEQVQYPLVCNLTEAFSDPRQVYFTQVTALLQAEDSKSDTTHHGFQPIKDTQMNTPLLTVTPCGRNLCVDPEPPIERLRSIYESLHYKLRIKWNSADPQHWDLNGEDLRRKILKDLVPGKQYCVSVRFSDPLVPRESNYSQPVCAFAPGTADRQISSGLILLVMFGMLIVALLVCSGFICLRGGPLPLVLTSIYHTQETLIAVPSSMSVSPLMIIKTTPPSAGVKRSHQTLSDESDEESVTESTDESRREDYQLRVGTNLLSSSSSSSLYSSPECETIPSVSSNQTPEVSTARPETPSSTERHSSARMNTHTDSHSDFPPDTCLPAHTDCSTGAKNVPNKQDKGMVGEASSHDVNLLTLTFSRHEEQEEEEEEITNAYMVELESPSASEVSNTTLILPSETEDTKEVSIGMTACCEEEKEEEEHSGYMGRPCAADVLQHLL